MSANRTLVTADIHASENPRDEYRFEFLRNLPSLARNHRIDEVYILGDLTEVKDRHSAQLVNRIMHHVNQVTARCNILMLRGNHDYLDRSRPFFMWLGHIHGIKWINEPIMIGDRMFLPHTDDYERDWKGLRFDLAKFIFAHNTFEGAINEQGRPLPGIPLSRFPSDVPIISGDVHTPQKHGNLTYVGAPYTIDFGDAYEPRVLLIDENDKVRSLHIDGPQKRLVQMKYVHGGVVEFKNDNLNAGDIVKVECTIKMEDSAKWWEIKEQIRNLCDGYKVTVHTIKPVVLYDATARMKAAKARAPREDSALMREYGKVRGIDERTLKTGLEIADDNEIEESP